MFCFEFLKLLYTNTNIQFDIKLKIITYYSEYKSILCRENNTDADDQHRKKFIK